MLPGCAVTKMSRQSWEVLRNCEQKVNIEEKLARPLHRNLVITLGKLSLRQLVIWLLKS